MAITEPSTRREFLRVSAALGGVGVVAFLEAQYKVISNSINVLQRVLAAWFTRPAEASTASEVAIIIERGDLWSPKEAEILTAGVKTDLASLGKMFGPSNKQLAEIKILVITDELREAWHWGKHVFNEGTNYQTADDKTYCEIYLDRADGDTPDNLRNTQDYLAHGLTHAFIGGSNSENKLQIDGQGYIFGKVAEVQSPKSGANALSFLGEELVAHFFGNYITNPTAIPPITRFTSEHGDQLYTGDQMLKALYEGDHNIFIKLRQLNDDPGLDDKSRLENVTKLFKAAYPPSLVLLHWE